MLAAAAHAVSVVVEPVTSSLGPGVKLAPAGCLSPRY